MGDGALALAKSLPLSARAVAAVKVSVRGRGRVSVRGRGRVSVRGRGKGKVRGRVRVRVTPRRPCGRCGQGER